METAVPLAPPPPPASSPPGVAVSLGPSTPASPCRRSFAWTCQQKYYGRQSISTGWGYKMSYFIRTLPGKAWKVDLDGFVGYHGRRTGEGRGSTHVSHALLVLPLSTHPFRDRGGGGGGGGGGWEGTNAVWSKVCGTVYVRSTDIHQRCCHCCCTR